MKVNSVQAAEILGCHHTTIAELRNKGLLKDYAEKKDGAKKHYSKYESSEVRELKRTWKPTRVRRTPPSVANSGPGLFASRLDRIEQKQDEIIALLSDIQKAWS